MGCDIHAYVEYSENGKSWRNLTVNAGERNYVMFGILAGVRVSQEQLFEPKGLPSGELGYKTRADYWFRIVPEDQPDWADTEGWTSRENAERWIERGLSRASYDNGKLIEVSDPDAHSVSWMTASELSRAVDRYREVVGKYWPNHTGAPTEWVMILAAMQAAEANGSHARVVFWFDN